MLDIELNNFGTFEPLCYLLMGVKYCSFHVKHHYVGALLCFYEQKKEKVSCFVVIRKVEGEYLLIS